jgi:hypothetical protein
VLRVTGILACVGFTINDRAVLVGLRQAVRALIPFLALICAAGQSAVGADDSEVRPPVTKTDFKIVNRARSILNTPSKWNRVS